MDLDLRAKLTALKLDIEPEWNTEAPVRKDSQWFIGKEFTLDGHLVRLAWYGDYKTGQKGDWKSDLNGGSNDPKVKAEVNKQVKLALEQERQAREKVWNERATELVGEFNNFSALGTTPYLERKGIQKLFGAKVSPNEHGDPILVIPLRDVDGKLWNYQRIYAQKLSKGDKFFEQGARIEGLFHVLLDVNETGTHLETIYLCEGFATACSVKMALGAGPHIVVSAFNAGNLQPVATELKSKYPTSKVIVCADNDAYTVINGREVNVGLEKGRRAAGAVGGEIRWPIFKYAAKGLTDFNDLHAAQGLDIVKDQLEHPGKYVTGVQPMLLPANKRGQPVPPTEKQVSDYLLKYLEGKIVRFDRSLFLYCGTHWVELDSMGTDKVKQWIGVASNHLLGIRDIDSYYKYLFTHSPQVPGGVDFFQPNPYAANFQNGTLHIRNKALEFEPHDPADYLTSTLPFEYPKSEYQSTSPGFDDMVTRLWANNLDKAQIHDFIDELIGACLLPAFPVIAFFVGKPKSGKSTIIKLLVRLLSSNNVCSVQPCDMHGFNMETMVAKLVNFDTDIDINRPMNDSEIKKIIDRVPRRVRRKNRTDVSAYLPAVHLFAANGLPKSLDGASRAFGHRFVIIQTESWTAGETFERDFELKLLERERPGIIARGLRGIERLLKNDGRFTVPKGSFEKVIELEMDSDIVGQFLDEVSHGEIYDKSMVLVNDPEGRIERKVLWEVFSVWQEGAIVAPHQRLGRTKFFQRMETLGFEATQSKGVRRFVGLRVGVPGAQIC